LPQKINIEHWQGNTRRLRLVSSADLTGVTLARWWLAKKVTSTGTDIFVMKSSAAPGEITIDIPNSTIIVDLLPDDTENVPAGSWYMECEVIDGQNRVTTLFTGKFKVNNVVIPADLDVT
jgi:hypothetical protein